MTTRERYRQDALYELASVEADIASARKTLEHTANANTARTKLAVMPSLERRAQALRDEAAKLPERPERQWDRRGDGNFRCLTRDGHAEPFTEAELAALAIPAFLERRT